MWSAELDGWACVADESFAASQFVPFMSLPGQGEGQQGTLCGRVCFAGVGLGRGRRDCWARARCLGVCGKHAAGWWSWHFKQGFSTPTAACILEFCPCMQVVQPAVPDPSRSANNSPSAAAAAAGEIATLQAEALRAAIPRPGLPGLQLRLGVLQQAVASRAHLEASLSTALALQSPQEYRRWLLAYARFLAEQGDAGRLAEVCASLLGDASGGGGSGGRGDTDMAEAAGAAGGDGGELVAWQPAILGLPKRELLREVLKEMSRNRSLQRTTQTYLDALGELEKAVERQRQAAAAAAATAAAAEAAAAAGSGGGAAILQPAAFSQQQVDAMPATRDPRIS